jgi:hypothetical protein
MRRNFFLISISSGALAACSLIPGTEQHAAERARALLSPTLFDADSAKFTDVRRVHINQPPEDIICGKINAKNQLGAYTGFRRFFASEGDGFAVVERDGDSQEVRNHNAGFAAVWEKCEP